jgi:ABC-2 type transport system permease protein
MRGFSTIVATEARLSLRGGDMPFFGVIFPIGIMLLMGFLSGTEGTRLSFAGIATIGICASAFMGIPLTFASYRKARILKRFHASPASASLLLAAVTAVQTAFALVSGLAVFLTARLSFGVEISGGTFRFAWTFALSLFTMYGFGFLIASLVPDIKKANVVCSLLYFPTLILSGATVPHELLPTGLRLATNAFPLTHAIRLLKGAVLGTDLARDAATIAALVACALLSYAVSFATFKWE